MEEKKPPYLHAPLLNGVVSALQDIFRDNRYADKSLELLFRLNPRWGSRDRGLVAECVYDLVRWWRLYWYLINENSSMDPHALGRVAGAWAIRKGVALPKVPLFAGLDADKLEARFQAAQKLRAIAQSVPDWLDAEGVKEMGEEAWEAELKAMNHAAPLVIRVNLLRNTKAELKKILEDAGLKAENHPLSPDALVVEKKGNIFQLDAFKDGRFELQDAGSQCIAPYLEAKPGMYVVDACAGAGGKSLHLAALMQGKGRIYSLDTDERKLEELRKRARRDGVSNIEARGIEGGKTIKRLYEKADRLLLDVPCSGMGVLRRNPDAKWKLSPGFLSEVRKKQEEILGQYSRMLKPGGELVYATCSIFPSENEGQIKRFLDANTAYEFVEERHILPSLENSDGFYMCRIRRKA